MCKLCRRNFLRGLAGFSAVSTLPSSLLAEGAQNPEGVRRPPADIRPRAEFIIRNAHLMTMDTSLGDIPGGSVHVRNGEIVAVGREIGAPGVQVIVADDMIVLPGLIETHCTCGTRCSAASLATSRRMDIFRLWHATARI